MANVNSFGVPGDAAYASPPETLVQITRHHIVYNANGTPDHTDYTLETITTLPTFHNKRPTVIRRYNDFIALRERLRSEVSAEAVRVIPPLAYSWLSVVLPSTRFEPEFIKTRQGDLTQFLDGVVHAPQLMFTVALRQFLENVELDWY